MMLFKKTEQFKPGVYIFFLQDPGGIRVNPDSLALQQPATHQENKSPVLRQFGFKGRNEMSRIHALTRQYLHFFNWYDVMAGEGAGVFVIQEPNFRHFSQ